MPSMHQLLAESIPQQVSFPDNRSVEYKQTGWKLQPDGKHLVFTDGCNIGRLRLVGNKKQQIATFPIEQLKRVRIVRRADGYYAQFGVRADRRLEHRNTGKQVGIDVGLQAYPHLSWLWCGSGQRP